MIPPEALSDIEADALWTAAHVGAPGCPARVRAEATARLVQEYRALRAERFCARCESWAARPAGGRCGLHHVPTYTAGEVGAALVAAKATIEALNEDSRADNRTIGSLEATFTRAAKLVDQLPASHAEWCPLESVVDPEHPRPCRCHAPVVAALRAMFLEVP